MSKRMKWSLGLAAIVPVVAWLGGYNFDSRGFGAVMCSVGVAFVFVATWTFPGWPDGCK
jgi:hypothetical protein